jgi:large subunit ribosomal protein L29
MKAQDIRNMSDSDLNEKIQEEKVLLAKMKFSHGIAGTENPMLIRSRRKNIARMITVMNQRNNKK